MNTSFQQQETPNNTSGDLTREFSVGTDAPARTGFGLWDGLAFFVCLFMVLGTLFYLTRPEKQGGAQETTAAIPIPEVVVTETGEIHVAPDSKLWDKLHQTTLERHRIDDPLVRVGGTLAAGRFTEDGKPQWQFQTPELLTAYTDWQKALADVVFTQEQLAAAEELVRTKAEALTAQIERKKKLVEIGTDTEQDLSTMEAERIEQEIEGRREIYEAQTAVRTAQSAEASASRQLEQEGLAPKLIDELGENARIVLANIPESLFDTVSVGQHAHLYFSGLAGTKYEGTVQAIVPVVSSQLRTIRVLLVLEDPENRLRPGMFADVELGTEERDVLLAPTDGVVHIGSADYLLVRQDAECWRVAPVQVGASHDDGVILLDGPDAGSTVLGMGAILLKGSMIESLEIADYSLTTPVAEEMENVSPEENEVNLLEADLSEKESENESESGLKPNLTRHGHKNNE